MIKRVPSKNATSFQVTFELPPEVNAQTAFLCGEFNDWDTQSLPMKRRKDGGFSVKLSLKPGRAYRFRYFLDGDRWENDWDADDYVQNSLGSMDSVIQL
jgi:1,4-alpha-glucan branching enzyme